MTDQVQALFTPVQVDDLTASAIELGFAYEYGVRSIRTAADLPLDAPTWWTDMLPGLLFPYTGLDGRMEPQLKPDFPKALAFGSEPSRYLFRSRGDGYVTTPWVIEAPKGNHPVIFVEGAKKALAVTAVRPQGWGVVAISSCTGGAQGGVGSKELALAHGRTTYVCMDGDYELNHQVWSAGQELFEHLKLEQPTLLRMIKLPKSNKAKIDDLLAARPEADRRRFLWALIETAVEETFPVSRKPKVVATTPGADSALEARLFAIGTLDAKVAAEELIKRMPMALLSRNGPVAVYRGGVYQSHESALRVEMGRLCGGRYRRSYVDSVEDILLGILEGSVLPERSGHGWLNVANGLLNLDDGSFREHTPEILSTVQIPVEWDVTAQCPRYEKWVTEQAGADQVDVLEEAAAAMLDQRMAPEKALMLFGPSRTGKGTFIRILEALAGDARSAVTLHQLGEDRFAAAELRGSILNAAAEVSSRELKDTSLFKQLTGRDLIQANQKYGRQFKFRNQALFVFACNHLPIVNDSDNAYLNRVVPVFFGKTFEGHQDPRVEAGLMEELPGILKRLVLALARRRQRGADATVPARIKRGFELGSNSAREWVALCTSVEEEAQDGVTTTALHAAYTGWAGLVGRRAIGMRAFSEVLSGMTATYGVEQRRAAAGRWWNLRVLPADEWGEALFLDPEEKGKD